MRAAGTYGEVFFAAACHENRITTSVSPKQAAGRNLRWRNAKCEVGANVRSASLIARLLCVHLEHWMV